MNKKAIITGAILVATLLATSCSNPFVSEKKETSKAETTTKTTTETTISTEKREAKGDMTIKKAFKLDVTSDGDFPLLIGDKVITSKKTGEALKTFVDDEGEGSATYGFYPMEIGITNCETGEYKAIFSETMLDFYMLTPGYDKKTVFLQYYPKENMEYGSDEDIHGYEKVQKTVKIDIESGKTEQLDFGSDESVGLQVLGDNNLIISQHKQEKTTKEDFEGRTLGDNSLNDYPETNSLTLYFYDDKTKKLEKLYYNKMAYFVMKKGEKQIWSVDSYDKFAVFKVFELSDDGTMNTSIEVYDTDMKLIYKDTVDSLKDYTNNGDQMIIDASCSDGVIYVCSQKMKAGDEKYKAVCYTYTYNEKDKTFAKKEISSSSMDERNFYQYTKRVNPYLNFDILQTSERESKTSNVKLYNCCTGEEYDLKIEVNDFTPPQFMYGNLPLQTDYSGGMILASKKSDKSDDYYFWYVPKEEIIRAIYGE